MSRWDHTALLAAETHNLGVLLAHFKTEGKSKMQVKTMQDFHPFRKKQQQGLIINNDNFGILKGMIIDGQL